jgi:hypothetical protein
MGSKRPEAGGPARLRRCILRHIVCFLSAREAHMAKLPPLPYDARHWRDRAEEARQLAENMRNRAARQAMLQVAASYDRLAKRVAIRRPKRRPA